MIAHTVGKGTGTRTPSIGFGDQYVAITPFPQIKRGFLISQIPHQLGTHQPYDSTGQSVTHFKQIQNIFCLCQGATLHWVFLITTFLLVAWWIDIFGLSDTAKLSDRSNLVIICAGCSSTLSPLFCTLQFFIPVRNQSSLAMTFLQEAHRVLALLFLRRHHTQ